MEEVSTEPQPYIIRYEEITDPEREILIDIVKLYPVIWDPAHSDRTKRNKLNEAYTEVSEEMNILTNGQKRYPVDVVKRTWKGLRENFVYYIGKRRNTVKYANDNSNIKFRFYNRMSFMLKPAPNFASYEECISMLANSSANGSVNNDDTTTMEQFPATLTPNGRKRSNTGSPQYSDISKQARIDHQPNEKITSNGVNSNPNICPAALSVESTNNDLISANMSHIARQFRNEIASVVKKYEEILIEFEKEVYQ